MKFQDLLFCFSLLLFAGCQDDSGETPLGELKCAYELGYFNLIDSHASILPYDGKSKAIFKDSSGNTVVFDITKEESSTYYTYFVTNLADNPVKYCYITHRISYLLVNNNLFLNFGIDLNALPFTLDGHVSDVYDQLLISGIPTSAFYTSAKLVFAEYARHPADTFSGPGIVRDPLYACFGKNFSNVDFLNTSADLKDPYEIHFNFTEGIVSFRDVSRKKWCFDTFQ